MAQGPQATLDRMETRWLEHLRASYSRFLPHVSQPGSLESVPALGKVLNPDSTGDLGDSALTNVGFPKIFRAHSSRNKPLLGWPLTFSPGRGHKSPKSFCELGWLPALDH